MDKIPGQEVKDSNQRQMLKKVINNLVKKNYNNFDVKRGLIADIYSRHLPNNFWASKFHTVN
eukprot:CAMPEP_0170554106 /NCGR_PEP_ID=MMETSP0211-20121228/11991_1 /TAXON_ID=311385 /ORGANISM="Pseudokeronopsis sp., Strain OXSARD2" /LENGTH=61 /DNA_ID=CAMNT_0010862957 /DNA_START=21 /DNA_END=206 /DNA_ORIENTATION=-